MLYRCPQSSGSEWGSRGHERRLRFLRSPSWEAGPAPDLDTRRYLPLTPTAQQGSSTQSPSPCTCCPLCVEGPSLNRLPGKLTLALKASCATLAKRTSCPRPLAKAPWVILFTLQGGGFFPWSIPQAQVLKGHPGTKILATRGKRLARGHRCHEPGPL